MDLIGQAPSLKKWKFVAFRQPRKEVKQIVIKILL